MYSLQPRDNAKEISAVVRLEENKNITFHKLVQSLRVVLHNAEASSAAA